MLTVKVGAFTHANAPARVGLMLREGPSIQLAISRGTPAVMLTVTAGMGVQFMGRVMPFMMGTVTAVERDQGPGLAAPHTDRAPGQPAQSRVTGSYSLDGATWTEVGVDPLSLPEPFLIGAYATSSGGSVPRCYHVDRTFRWSARRPPPGRCDAGASDGGM